MRSKIRNCLAWITLLLSVGYPVGDHFGLWDVLRGRDVLENGISRLSKSNGYPGSCIFDTEPEFKELLLIINKNTANQYDLSFTNSGKKPTCITIDGSLMRRALLPEGFPGGIDIPNAATVLFLYDFFKEGDPRKTAEFAPHAVLCCDLESLRVWKDDQVKRFILNTLVIGLLSIITFCWRTIKRNAFPHQLR